MKHRAGLLLFPDLGVPRPASAPVQPQLAAPQPRAADDAVEPAASPSQSQGPRYLFVHLPAFALERCGHAASELAACLAEQRGADRVVACTPAAVDGGVTVGMTASQARALLPEIVFHPHDSHGEQVDHTALLQTFARFGDRVAAWGAAGVLIDVGRTAHLFGGEQPMVDRVLAHVRDLGHHACGVVAEDPCAAQALAEWQGCTRCVPPGQGRAALAALPFRALRPSAALLESAQALGIERVEQWAALDPASVAGRFGAEGLRLLRLAQGRVVTRLPWRDLPAGPVVESVVLGGPTVTLEPIFFVLPGVLRRLAEQLTARSAMAVQLAVRLGLERGPPHLVRLRVGQPSRDPERLLSLLRARLDRTRLVAPAIELWIEVEEQVEEQACQPDLLERSTAAEPLADLIARLADTLGPASVFGPALRDTCRPESAWAARPFEPGAPPPLGPVHRKHDRDPVALQRAYEPELPRPRPLLLSERPERVACQVAQGRPARVRWLGAWQPVTACEGPERLHSEWWVADGGIVRDYWVVQILDRVAWCFLDDRGQWYVHGWFD